MDAFNGLTNCRKAWHIVASGAGQRRRERHHQQAGPESKPVRETKHRNEHRRSNTTIDWALVYFLPDRILVKDARTYIDIQYRELRIHNHSERFIENSPVPPDSVQVGTTWKYVNKRGGPDRRFKDSRQLPVMQYGRIDLTAPGGLNILWSFSQVPSAQAFSAALSRLGQQTT